MYMSNYMDNSSQHGAALFNNLTGGTLISGGTFVLNCIQNDNTARIENTFLDHYVVLSATHDSNDVPNPPQCHPGTRVALLKQLSDWINNTDDSTRIFWLFGPAGSGKTAIAQSFAEGLSTAGHLVASFFFSRMDARRNTVKSLVATLLYQITRHSSIPKRLQQNITAAILNDPMIFCRSLRTQFERLIVGPIEITKGHTKGSKLYQAPALILIDGLDECEDREAVKLVLNTILHVITRLGNNFKVLISSRPEDDIRRVFERSNIKDQIGFMELLSDSQAYNDIQFYLHNGLSQLKDTHPVGETLDSEWPSSEAIQALTRKSSGHFIYAHTVLKYIDSHCSRPQESLDAILSSRVTTLHNPYAELDAFYRDILSSSRADRKALSQVLSFSLVCIRVNNRFAELDLFIESLLSLDRGAVKLTLLDLCSVISLQKSEILSGSPTWSIKFEHMSFVDFLVNDSRSGEFYVNLRQTCIAVAKACSEALSDKTYLTKFWPIDTGQKHKPEKLIKSAYQRVLTWCRRRTAPDPELQTKLLTHDAPKSLPPGAATKPTAKGDMWKEVTDKASNDKSVMTMAATAKGDTKAVVTKGDTGKRAGEDEDTKALASRGNTTKEGNTKRMTKGSTAKGAVTNKGGTTKEGGDTEKTNGIPTEGDSKPAKTKVDPGKEAPKQKDTTKEIITVKDTKTGTTKVDTSKGTTVKPAAKNPTTKGAVGTGKGLANKGKASVDTPESSTRGITTKGAISKVDEVRGAAKGSKIAKEASNVRGADKKGDCTGKVADKKAKDAKKDNAKTAAKQSPGKGKGG